MSGTLSGIYTMGLTKSLVGVVSRLSSEVEYPKNDTATLKLQIQDLYQESTLVPLM
jgi:hypothetical protein